MGRAGCAWVVAALASGCLQAPPAASGDAGSDSIDAGSDILLFPPSGAAVRIEAALAADVDSDGREDLVLLDSEVADDWAGLYILRAGPDGWTGIDEVRLDFRPTAAHFARLLRASGPALAVGGNGGNVALVDYTADAGYEVVPLEFNGTTITGPIAIVHSGLYDATDPRASLLLYDGTTLYRSTPIDEGNPMQLASLSTGSYLDAAFWPLDGTDQAKYIAGRAESKIEWYDAEGGVGTPDDGAVAARFAHLVSGLCGSYLAVGTDQTLSIGSIACDGSSSALYPLEGAAMDQIAVMAAGDFDGTLKHDVALVGYAGGSLVGQVLIDINFAVDSYTAATASATIAIDGATPPTFLIPVDAEGDDSALIYSVRPAGDIDCGRVAGAVAEPCPGRWQVRAR